MVSSISITQQRRLMRGGGGDKVGMPAELGSDQRRKVSIVEELAG